MDDKKVASYLYDMRNKHSLTQKDIAVDWTMGGGLISAIVLAILPSGALAFSEYQKNE